MKKGIVKQTSLADLIIESSQQNEKENLKVTHQNITSLRFSDKECISSRQATMIMLVADDGTDLANITPENFISYQIKEDKLEVLAKRLNPLNGREEIFCTPCSIEHNQHFLNAVQAGELKGR